MDYISVSQAAEKWGVSERSIRNYCQQGRIIGAVLNGHSWLIPENSEKPDRKKRQGKVPDDLLSRLRIEKEAGMTGGIYHKIQIELTYNSNHIEGSRLTKVQTRYIFETNTIGISDSSVNVDDIIETANHFRCIDLVIDQAKYVLTEGFIKQLHLTLKNGTMPAFADVLPFILRLVLVVIVAPGVPGGAVTAALGLFQTQLGFDAGMLGLLTALDIAQDSFESACNASSDGAAAIFLEALLKRGKKRGNAA